jgi:hypothetical protein
MEVSDELHASATLPAGKEPQYRLDRGLGGPLRLSGRGSEGKNSQPLPHLEHPIIQPIVNAIPLSFPGVFIFAGI